MQLELDGPTDLAGFRAAARRLFAQQVNPDQVQWRVASESAPELALFDTPTAHCDADARAPRPDSDPVSALRVPAGFVDLCRDVVLHRDPRRFDLLYRLLWRLQREPTLRHDPLDDQMRQAQQWARAVSHDLHKMKAFVRFRALADTPSGSPLHVAWFEPAHHIVDAVAPFFVRRFASMRWAILTPERCLRWEGSTLVGGPGARREDAPPPDAGESLWLTYYQSIFNPARLKLRMMEKEMPRRYWRNLPEAALIGALAAQAAPRMGAMVARGPTAPRAGARMMQPIGREAVERTAIPTSFATAAASQRQQEWTTQRDAAAGCRNCPLGALATQTVWGEGPIGANLMLVGEQPGDQEDLRGQPFVGPAGQLLDRALAQLGWDRSTIYVTNSVKHFKYEPRGKRRMHKTPSQREADACLHWLEAELALVQPKAIIALGATAARQLLGRPVAVLRERGQWLQRADGVPVLLTLHPSALLRADPGDREIQYQAWIGDLAQAGLHVGAGSFIRVRNAVATPSVAKR